MCLCLCVGGGPPRVIHLIQIATRCQCDSNHNVFNWNLFYPPFTALFHGGLWTGRRSERETGLEEAEVDGWSEWRKIRGEMGRLWRIFSIIIVVFIYTSKRLAWFRWAAAGIFCHLQGVGILLGSFHWHVICSCIFSGHWTRGRARRHLGTKYFLVNFACFSELFSIFSRLRWWKDQSLRNRKSAVKAAGVTDKGGVQQDVYFYSALFLFQ